MMVLRSVLAGLSVPILQQIVGCGYVVLNFGIGGRYGQFPTKLWQAFAVYYGHRNAYNSDDVLFFLFSFLP